MVPVTSHSQVKTALRDVEGYAPSAAEASVWIPADADAILSSLGVISLLKPLPQMPDPTTSRETVSRLLERLQGNR